MIIQTKFVSNNLLNKSLELYFYRRQ